MSSPYIGEIRIFAGTFAPVGWATCDGQLLAISQNDALFTLIGTTYGGDGQTTFGLPDLRGRIPIHQGQGGGLSNYVLGQSSGTETVTVTTTSCRSIRMRHPPRAAWVTFRSPAVPFPRRTAIIRCSIRRRARRWPRARSRRSAQTSRHENMPPFLCINFIISLFGIFPSQN
jgi:microcystin-dependent protein